MNTSTIMTPSTFQVKPLMSDFECGYKSYWLGHSDSRCGNQEQVRGWYSACEEDDRGRAAYLKAMRQASEAGEAIDWAGVCAVLDAVLDRHNAFGDKVS